MNRISMAFAAVCLGSSLSAAQAVDGRIGYDSGQLAARTNFAERNFGARENLGGGVCVRPPYYNTCSYDYNYYNLNLYHLWRFYTFWNSMEERDRPQPTYTIRLPEPSPPPAPPPTPVMHEYHWPEQVNTSATFTIVTTSGTVYLAVLVWVEGGNVHFNSVDGGVRQIPLSSVSRSFTQTANAERNLTLPLPSVEVAELTVSNSEAAAAKAAVEVRSRGN